MFQWERRGLEEEEEEEEITQKLVAIFNECRLPNKYTAFDTFPFKYLDCSPDLDVFLTTVKVHVELYLCFFL
jgi:hypothetical protein